MVDSLNGGRFRPVLMAADPASREKPRCDAAILVAMAEEIVDLRKRISPSLIGGDGRMHGQWAGRSVRLQETGPGLRQAEAAARRMLEGCRPAAIMCAGVAGGLHPALRRGQLVAASEVVDALSQTRYASHPSLLAAASQVGASQAILLSSSRIVCSAAEKRALSNRADMVDMESLAVARVAAEYGVPFLGLRVISDTADESFPVDFNDFLDPDGQMRPVALAMVTLRRRGGLRFLLGLQATVRAAARRLADAVEQLLPTPIDVNPDVP